MRVLVVEDDPIIAMSAQHTLQHAGHLVLGPFSSVASAMAGARASFEDRASFADVAVIDINLAGHDEGLDLARRLRAEFALRCIFASGQTETARANRDAAMGLLQKPYSDCALSDAMPVLAALLAGSAPPPLPPGLELW